MSSLLQSVLSAKLAGTSLDEEGRAQSHDAAMGEDWEEVNTSDEEMVAIATAPGTGTGTPANISRPTSPGSSKPTSGKSTLSNERPVKVKAPKSKTDPLRSLPKEVSPPLSPSNPPFLLARLLTHSSSHPLPAPGITTYLPPPTSPRTPLPLPRLQTLPQIRHVELLLVSQMPSGF